MIPDFPQFKRVDLEDNDAVEARTKYFPYYSDYNFTSLWCWDIGRRREISVLNDSLIIKFTDYEDGSPFFSFLGMRNNLDTAITLLDFSESLGLPPELRLMPEVSVFDIEDPKLKIATDRSNYDYIYLTERMATFEGNQYKSKRKAAEKFEKMNPTYGFEILGLTEPKTQEIVHSVAESWRIQQGKTDDDQSIVHETEAIRNIFQLAPYRDLFVGVLSIDGIPTSFTIEEVVNNILSIGHFWKTAQPSQGEYEFLCKKTAEYLVMREVTYWNWEQDLGIPTLEASKSSYRPADFLKKYIVRRISS